MNEAPKPLTAPGLQAMKARGGLNAVLEVMLFGR